MKLIREFCKIWLPLIVILGIGFYITWLFVPPSAPKNLRIASGSQGGAYHLYSQQYQSALQKEGVKLELQSTAGSVESLQLLKDGKVDMAFIQGGIGEDTTAEDGLHSIASLFYEPLWVFTAKQPSQEKLCYLKKLEGKKLAIGSEGSGTRALVKRLLNDSGLNADNAQLLDLGGEEAISQLEAGEIDAAFFVASPKSANVSRLVNQENIHITRCCSF